MESALEDRVDTLEYYMKELAHQQWRTDIAVQSLAEEMKGFKDEMKGFKDEMKDFKDEMKDFKDEMKDFKDEMKNDLKAYKEENRQERRNMNKQWGDLANKMGTIVEDIVAPAVRPVLKKYFNVHVEHFFIKSSRHLKDSDLKGEYDVVAVEGGGRNRVFLVEVKSTATKQYILDFIKSIEKFRALYKEYRDREIVPIFASLRLEDDIVAFATENRVYAMAYMEWDYMDILNFDAM